MSLASQTRRAIDDLPFLHTALRADVLNYSKSARFLPVEGDPDAVSTAIGRYAEELPPLEIESTDARVSMHSGVGPVEPGSTDATIRVGDTAYGDQVGGELTAIVVEGAIDGRLLATALGRLSIEGISPDAAGVADERIVIIVDRLDGANAVRVVERALDAVPVEA